MSNRRKPIDEHTKQLIIMHHVKEHKNDIEISRLLGLSISVVSGVTNKYWEDKMKKAHIWLNK